MRVIDCSLQCGEDHLAYSTVHNQLSRERGKATKFPCHDCDKDATEWSYTGDPHELVLWDAPEDDESQVSRIRYAENLDAYAPRCKPCHTYYDQQEVPCRTTSRKTSGTSLSCASLGETNELVSVLRDRVTTPNRVERGL